MFSFVESLLQQMFTCACVHCKNAVDVSSCDLGSWGLCTQCMREVSTSFRHISPTDFVSSVWAMDPYHGPLGSLVKNGKYKGREQVFRKIGRHMAGACLDLPPFDIVTFVPLSWHRKMHRGFDQAEIVSQEIAKFLDLPHLSLLQRMDYTRQAEKSRKERQKQLTGRFRVQKDWLCDSIPQMKKEILKNTPYILRDAILPNQIRNKTILLVDDVCTTGSTLDGCAIELYNAGVSNVLGCAAVSSTLG